MMISQRSTPRFGPVTCLALCTLVAACHADGPAGPAPVVTVPVASVELVTPAFVSLGPNDSLRLTAVPRDSAGQPLAGKSARWQSSDTTVMTVDSMGGVRAKPYEFNQPKSATISVTIEGRSASLTLSQLRYTFADDRYQYVGYFNRKRYFLSKAAASWQDSYEMVRGLGIDRVNLAVVRDAATNEFLATRAGQFPMDQQYVHIGAFYDRRRSTWRWVDGAQMVYNRFINQAEDYLSRELAIGAFLYVKPNIPNWNIAGAANELLAAVEERSVNDASTMSSAAPIAYFDVVSSSCTAPYQVVLRNLSVGSGSHTWTFGDGSSSTESSPSHRYESPGPFTIQLRSVNAHGVDVAERVVNLRCATYTTFNGSDLQVVPWEGRHVAVLTLSQNRDVGVMQRMVANLDSAFAYYVAITGRQPTLVKAYNGKPTIVEVPSTCGAGCAYVGATGIEIQRSFFNMSYSSIALRSDQDFHIAYFEFGRNFWFYGSQLTYGSYTSPMAFATHSQFGAMRRAGLASVAPLSGRPWAAFERELRRQFGVYLADTTLRFENTLLTNTWVNQATSEFPHLDGSGLFASLLFMLEDRHGGDAFTAAFWRAVQRRPAARSVQDAVDNLVMAASAAAEKDLTAEFVGWRFPVSAAAVQEARGRWP
jgi:hypothetical protein